MQVEKYEGYANVILPEVIDLINAPEFKKALKSLYVLIPLPYVGKFQNRVVQ